MLRVRQGDARPRLSGLPPLSEVGREDDSVGGSTVKKLKRVVLQWGTFGHDFGNRVFVSRKPWSGAAAISADGRALDGKKVRLVAEVL